MITSADLDEPGPRIEYVNAAFTQMTGYRPDEVIGRTPRMLQGPRTERATMAGLRAALEQGNDYFGMFVNYRKDGTEFINEWLITPFRDAQGHIAHWVSSQRDVSDRVRSKTVQEILLAELNHRVLNNLAAVQSLAARIGRTSSSIEELRGALQKRLYALAQSQKAIADAHWHSVSLHALSQAQMAPFGVGIPGRVEASGPEIHLRSGAAVVLGLALHELGLNALRHGSLSMPEGRIGLKWWVAAGVGGDHLHLDWTETGGRAVVAPTHRGFGLRLIEEVLAREMRGKAHVYFNPPGVRCLIDAPLAGIVEQSA